MGVETEVEMGVETAVDFEVEMRVRKDLRRDFSWGWGGVGTPLTDNFPNWDF